MALKFFLLMVLMRISFSQTGEDSLLYPCKPATTNVVYSNDSDTVIVSLNDTYCNEQPRTPKVSGSACVCLPMRQQARL